MSRPPRSWVEGSPYHLTVRGNNRQTIFLDAADYREYTLVLHQCRAQYPYRVLAFALMANHVHLLVEAVPESSLSDVMRWVGATYTRYFNERHQRLGHLYQGRFYSNAVDRDSYLLEVTRYIHLNPLRANLVKDLASLDRYRWCGHTDLMGARKHPWQHVDDVLSWFGKTEGAARRAYRDFVKEGIPMGRRPELVGGGLVRSQGGWSQVMTMRRRKVRELSDERILGSGDFVERILEDAEKSFQRSFRNNLSVNDLETLILKACKTSGIHIDELRSGGRRQNVSGVRSRLAVDLVRHHGISLAEAARQLGVSTPAIWNLLMRTDVES